MEEQGKKRKDAEVHLLPSFVFRCIAMICSESMWSLSSSGLSKRIKMTSNLDLRIA